MNEDPSPPYLMKTGVIGFHSPADSHVVCGRQFTVSIQTHISDIGNIGRQANTLILIQANGLVWDTNT